MIRLFAGIELPENIKEQLYALRGGVPNAKWVEKDNLHITLRFIGNIDEDDANDLHDGFMQLRAPAFDLQMAQVGFLQTAFKCGTCGPASATIRPWISCMTNWKALYPATVCRPTNINFTRIARWQNFTAPASKTYINF